MSRPTFNIFVSLIASLTVYSCGDGNEKATNKSSDLSFLPVVRAPIIADKDQMVGFACGEAGEQTSLVSQFSEWVLKKEFKKIREKLTSTNPGEVFLATFTCDKLQKNGLITLSDSNKDELKSNFFRKDSIMVCSGCSEYKKLSLIEILADTGNYMNSEAEWWINELLDQNNLYQ